MKPSLPEAARPTTTALPPEVTVAGPHANPTPTYVSAGSGATLKQDHTGQQLGDFRLVRRLGEGGMGQVYLAEQISLNRRVAIKVLRADFADNQTFLKRFEAEAKAVAQLTHPNIVQVYSVGNVDNTRFMALEYVEGTNLKDYLNKKGPPELPIALAIMRQIAAALLKAAELGIIHRDIKPENILLTRKVEVKVADFGLSRIVGDDVHLTQTGTTMGTPLFMSPEQITGKEIDPRSDLYSFGATCYHLLTGQPPFLADTAMAVGIRHLTDQAKPIQEYRPDLPKELCDLVHRMLAKKPDDRPQTAREVLREIRKIQESLNGTQPMSLAKTATHESDLDTDDYGVTLTDPLPSAALTDRMKTRSRHWLASVVGGSLMVAIIGGAIIGMILRGETPAATRTASVTATRPNSKKVLDSAILGLEKSLKQKVEETRYQREMAKTDPFPLEKMQLGVQKRAELMRFYVLNMDEETAIRAKQFCDNEINAPFAPDPYRSVGLIGQAVLLAYEGKAKESYDSLEKALSLRGNANPKRPMPMQMMRNKDVVELIAITFRLNEERMPVPENLKVIKEEIDKLERGTVPDKNRPGKS